MRLKLLLNAVNDFNVTYPNSTLLKPTKKGSCKLYRPRANAADDCAGSPNELAISLDTHTIYPRSVYKKKPCRDKRGKGLKKTYWFPWLIGSIILSWTLGTWVVSRYTRIHERVQPGLQATESICLHVKRHWLLPVRLLTWKRGWGRSFLIHFTLRHWSNCGSYHLREYMRAMRYDVSPRVFDSQFHLRTKLTSERSSRTQGFEPLIIFRRLPKIAEDFWNFPRKCSRWFDYALIWYLLTVLLVACERAHSSEFGKSEKIRGVCTVKISPEQEQVNLPIGYAIGTELFLPEVMKFYLPEHWIRCMWLLSLSKNWSTLSRYVESRHYEDFFLQ